MSALTTGVISLVSLTQNVVNLICTAATQGTGPYTYQWCRSTTAGFVPGAGNFIAGATALTLADTSKIPGTTYYYSVISTDAVSSAVNAVQFTAVTSNPVPAINQFTQSVQLGMVDEHFCVNTIPVQVDASQTTPIYAGQAVSVYDSADGVPKVVATTSVSDTNCWGFVNYDIKTQAFTAGMPMSISLVHNVIYLYATSAIARGGQVVLDLATIGGVQASSGKTGSVIVGWAFDKAASAGTLIRVFLKTPTTTVV